MQFFTEKRAYPWVSIGNLRFRGYFFFAGECYADEAAAQVLLTLLDGGTLGTFPTTPETDVGAAVPCGSQTFPEALNQLNGLFSAVFEDGGNTWLGTDHARALPLFYAVQDGELLVSDQARLLREALGSVTFDETSVKEFEAAELFVSGHHTLFNGIFQIQAGEAVRFDGENGEISRVFYEACARDCVNPVGAAFGRPQQPHNAPESRRAGGVAPYNLGSFLGSRAIANRHCNVGPFADETEMREAFAQTYDGVGDRLVQALSGRTAILSLSGGADSRMVAELLLSRGYTNIVCYTYGRKGCADARFAEGYAREKGLQWHFIPYTRKRWREAARTGQFRDFLLFAGNYGSLPHIADYLAVKELTERGLIPADGVFVTGHCGDFFAGNFVKEIFLRKDVSREEFFASIDEQFYHMRALDSDVRARVEGYFDYISENQAHLFNLREHHAKYCANSERVHDFFGHRWLLPLWDRELIAFWERVPVEWRYRRRLYFACVDNTSSARSTNDPTAVKALGAAVRKSGLRALARKAMRIPQYFTYSLQFTGIVSFWRYLGLWAKGNELFGPRVVVKQAYMVLLRER